jgi:hypothetical protein
MPARIQISRSIPDSSCGYLRCLALAAAADGTLVSVSLIEEARMNTRRDNRQNPLAWSAALNAAAICYFTESTAMADSTALFETDIVGSPPKGWTATKTGTGEPKWTVEQDETAPSHSRIVKQSGRATYPVLLKSDTHIKDGFVEMKFKPIAGAEDRAAGLVWRGCRQLLRASCECAGGQRRALQDDKRCAACPRHRWSYGRLWSQDLCAGKPMEQSAGRVQRRSLQGDLQRASAVRGRGQDFCRSWNGGLVDQGRQRNAIRCDHLRGVGLVGMAGLGNG